VWRRDAWRERGGRPRLVEAPLLASARRPDADLVRVRPRLDTAPSAQFSAQSLSQSDWLSQGQCCCQRVQGDKLAKAGHNAKCTLGTMQGVQSAPSADRHILCQLHVQCVRHANVSSGVTLWLIDLDGFEDIRVGLHECLQGGCRWVSTRGAQGALLPWGPVVVGLRPRPAAMV